MGRRIAAWSRTGLFVSGRRNAAYGAGVTTRQPASNATRRVAVPPPLRARHLAAPRAAVHPERMPRARIGPRRAGPLALGRGDRTGCLPPGARSGGVVGIGWGK